ncbi:MAG: ribosome recycling factor [Mycobacteriales bacterium]
MEKLSKNGDVGEDDVRRAEKELDELTHRFTASVESMLAAKEAELLEV